MNQERIAGNLEISIRLLSVVNLKFIMRRVNMKKHLKILSMFQRIIKTEIDKGIFSAEHHFEEMLKLVAFWIGGKKIARRS